MGVMNCCLQWRSRGIGFQKGCLLLVSVFLVVKLAAGREVLQDRCRFVSQTGELAAFALWCEAGLHAHLL